MQTLISLISAAIAAVMALDAPDLLGAASASAGVVLTEDESAEGTERDPNV